MPDRNRFARLLWEAAMIVFSILLAFAINAAWQKHGERKEEKRILSALRDEFTVNQERIAQIVAFHTSLRTTAVSLMQATTQPATTSSETTDQLITDVSWWGGFISPESAALDAIVLGGKLDVIEDETLRRLLTAWRRDVSDAAAQETQEYDHYSRVWLPLLRAKANLAQISNTATTIPGTGTASGTTKMPVTLSIRDHRELLTDAEFQNALVHKVWIEDDALRAYQNLLGQLSNVRARLEREVTK